MPAMQPLWRIGAPPSRPAVDAAQSFATGEPAQSLLNRTGPSLSGPGEPLPPDRPAPQVPSASKPQAPKHPSLAGVWSTARSAKTASSFAPVLVKIGISESEGWLAGSLTGVYRIPKSARFNAECSFSFGGPDRGGSLKFAFAAPGGSKGTIELIRLPGNPNAMEVVWVPAGRDFVFDDLFYRMR